MLRYITKASLFIVLLCIAPKQVVAKHKSSQNTIRPTALYLGMDVVKTLYGWHQNLGNSYEINGSINFSRILLNADYGFGQIRRDGSKQNGSLANVDGRYYRIGLDYNFLMPTFHYNQFFIGLRFARSFFSFQLDSPWVGCKHGTDKTESCNSGNFKCTPMPSVLEKASSGIAHWWEIVVGGKVRLISIISIGCTARYKFGRKIENKLSVEPFDIPGFGLREDDYAFGYSLYILLRIPLQKVAKP